MAGTTLQDRSLLLRFETWREGLRITAERPLLGVGIGAFTATYARAMPAPPRSAHNVLNRGAGRDGHGRAGRVRLAPGGCALAALAAVGDERRGRVLGASLAADSRDRNDRLSGREHRAEPRLHLSPDGGAGTLARFDPGRAPGGSRGGPGQCIGRAAPARRGGRVTSTFGAADSGSPREQQARQPEMKLADGVFISQVAGLEQIPEAERLNPEAVVKEIKQSGRSAFYEENANAIVERILPMLKKKDIVTVFSNGGFDGIHEKLLSRLRSSL